VILASPREATDAAQALIEEARRRQRKRRLVVSFAVLVAAAGALIGFASSGGKGTHRVAPIVNHSAHKATPLLIRPARLSNSLLFVPGGAASVETNAPTAITVVNAGTGSLVTRLPFPAKPSWVYPVPSWVSPTTDYPWLVEGSYVVAVLGPFAYAYGVDTGTAFAFQPAQPAKAISLGPATYAFLAARPDAVWLTTDSAKMTDFMNVKFPSNRKCTIREETLAGVALTPTVPYPCDQSLLGVVDGGFLSSPNGAVKSSSPLQVWDPLTGRVVRTLVAGESVAATQASLVSFTSRYVVWSAPHPSCLVWCRTFVTDLSTGRSAALRLFTPSGSAVIGNALSPVAPLLAEVVMPKHTQEALFAARSAWGGPCCFASVGSGPAHLLIFNVTDGRLLSSRPITAGLPESIQWSADGSFVFVTRDQTDVGAYPAWSATASSRVVRLRPPAMPLDEDPVLSFLVAGNQ
jgi:hypothetical protein